MATSSKIQDMITRNYYKPCNGVICKLMDAYDLWPVTSNYHHQDASNSYIR